MKAAMTVDGKIATRTGESRMSSREDLRHLHTLRSLTDAVMIGIGTQLIDNPLLTVRRVNGRNPIRVVVDSHARTPPDSRILSTKDGGTIVAVSKKAPKTRVLKLHRAGAKVITCGMNHVNLKTLLAKLYTIGIRRILLEGGGKLNWSMLKDKLVDEISVTVAPMIIGGEKATTLVEGAGVTKMKYAFRLSLASMKRNGNELVLNYKVKN
jgi:2,5-diamino-6-(ribosylamino)-4(3H)-pyrimidinone 5'-phosphate reductase